MRARLLLDVRIADQLLHCMFDDKHAPAAQKGALNCAKLALTTGFAANDVDDGPATGVALSFCSRAWTSALSRVLRSNEQPFEHRQLALDALRAQASRGPAATGHWPAAEVGQALGAGLNAEAGANSKVVKRQVQDKPDCAPKGLKNWTGSGSVFGTSTSAGWSDAVESRLPIAEVLDVVALADAQLMRSLTAQVGGVVT